MKRRFVIVLANLLLIAAGLLAACRLTPDLPTVAASTTLPEATATVPAIVAVSKTVPTLTAAGTAARAKSAPAAPPTMTVRPVPTPGPGAMTVYAVSNPDSATLNLKQVFTNSSGFSYSFSDQVAPGATKTYHVSDIDQIPSPFRGSVTISGNHAFTARIVGYDYPKSPRGRSPTPTRRATAKSS